MKQPKYRVDQVVALLTNNTSCLDPTQPNYRIDTGLYVQIVEIVEETWEFKKDDRIQFSYKYKPRNGAMMNVLHESWFRALTGREITGRI